MAKYNEQIEEAKALQARRKELREDAIKRIEKLAKKHGKIKLREPIVMKGFARH